MVIATGNSKVALKEQVRRSLPTVTLEQIRIASPCKADWASMTGDEKSRHCGQCDKKVHDLSAMTRAEAEALVSGGQPYLCVRLWVRPDGKVLTQDCPVGLAKVRRSLRRVATFVGALVASLGGLLGCVPEDEAGGSSGGPVQTATERGGGPATTETGPDVPSPPDVAPIETDTGEVAPVDSEVPTRPDTPHVIMGRMVCPTIDEGER